MSSLSSFKSPSSFWTWAVLSGPISVSVAVIIGGIVTSVAAGYDVWPVKDMFVIMTIVMVMEMGTADRFFVKGIMRSFGTLTGGFFGFLINFGQMKMLEKRIPRVSVDAFIILSMALVAFAYSVCIKKWPEWWYAFAMGMMTTALLIYTPDITTAVARLASVVTGVLIGSIVTVFFNYSSALSVLLKTHERIVNGVFGLIQLALEGSSGSKSTFMTMSDKLRKDLVSADATCQVYSMWRWMSFRGKRHSLGIVSKEARPLFYEVFSFYWTMSSTPVLDHPDFEKYFSNGVASLAQSLESIRKLLAPVLSKRNSMKSDDIFDAYLTIVEHHLRGGCLKELRSLKLRYVDYEGSCKPSSPIRMGMCTFLVNLAALLTAAAVFVRESSTGVGDPRLGQLRADVDTTISDIRYLMAEEMSPTGKVAKGKSPRKVSGDSALH